MNTIVPRHALTKYASGVAGEPAVASEPCRLWLKVAKPFWNDDEIDLMILEVVDGQLVPIPVQVKSVQFLPNENGKAPDERIVSGLKARYVRNHKGICLAIYRPDFDEMWLIPGADAIRSLHAAQYMGSARATPFDEIPDESEVPIKVQNKWPDASLSAYEVPKPVAKDNDHGDVRMVSRAVRDLAKRLKSSTDYAAGLARVMEWSSADRALVNVSPSAPSPTNVPALPPTP